MTKRIFVTGSTGYLGSNLVATLKEFGFKLYLYKRGEDVKVIKKFKPDYIFNCAAELHNEKMMMESNFFLVDKLLMASKSIDYEAFVHIGTSSEYGRKKKPIREIDIPFPETRYGATKLNATILCQQFAFKNKKPVVILRPFSIFGNNEPEKRLIPTAIRHCLSGRILTLGRGVHDFVHVEDVVGAMLSIAKKDFWQIGGQIVNIGSGIETSNQEVIDLVSRTCGKKIKVEKTDRFRGYDTDHWSADISKALMLGWWPKILLNEGIERMVNDFKRKSEKHQK